MFSCRRTGFKANPLTYISMCPWKMYLDKLENRIQNLTNNCYLRLPYRNFNAKIGVFVPYNSEDHCTLSVTYKIFAETLMTLFRLFFCGKRVQKIT